MQCAPLVRQSDEEVCGGMIHTVDKVLLPPRGDIWDVVNSGNTYSKFMELVEIAEMREQFEKDARTLLLPSDGAFEKLDEATMSKLSENKILAAEVCFTSYFA